MRSRRLYHTLFVCFIFYALLCFPEMAKAVADEEAPFQISFDYALQKSGSTSNIIVKVTVELDEAYHTYAHSEKDVFPTTLTLQNAKGEPIEARAYYPQGEPYESRLDEGKSVGAYTGDFPVFIETSKEALEQKLSVDVSMLLCSEERCIPVSRQFPITPPTRILNVSEVPWEEEFFLYSGEQEQPKTETAVASSRKEGSSTTFTPTYLKKDLEPTKIEFALLLGFLAGLILNVMPCVLPVLTLKFSFILSHLQGQNEESYLRTIRIQNLFFAFGVISWFFLLALGLEFLGLAWGGFFQNISVVFVLILIIFILALSLFDIFTLPVIDFKMSAPSHPYIQSYFTGLMTTLLATPCSGPLLGGVLGWAILQPPYVLFIVFFSTSLGMSLPYFIFAIYPKALSFLPKPGAWCLYVERLVGFFLLGTIVYLLSILPERMLFPTLITLLVTAFATWVWGNWGGISASRTQRFFVGCLAVAMVALSVWLNFQPSVDSDDPYSKESFQEVLGKKPILLEFTADWCPTCKFLEKTVLTKRFLYYAIQKYNLTPIRIDLTLNNPEGEALLRSLGSVSIPVTAIFPAGERSSQPMVLRDVYTSEQLEQALEVTLEGE